MKTEYQIFKETDDPDNILRMAIGQTPEGQGYAVFRGDSTDCLEMLKAALRAFEQYEELTRAPLETFVCRLCKKSPFEIQGHLIRVNEKGVAPIWECRPSCDVKQTPDEQIINAIDPDEGPTNYNN